MIKTVDYELKRMKRKTIAISITSFGKVIVKAPSYVSVDSIDKFVCEKQEWILSRIKKQSGVYMKYNDIIELKSVLIFGDKFKIDYYEQSKTVVKLDYANKTLFLPQICQDNKTKAYRLLNKFFLSQTKEYIHERLPKILQFMGVTCDIIRIMNNKTRWGVCRSSGILEFNLKLSMLDPTVIEYVIIHEVAHFYEMNHSKQYWSIVEKYMPNYKKYRKELKDNDIVTSLYR